MTNIPLNKILPNPEQPRRIFDESDLESLAQSIRENGVIQPIAVEEAHDGFYILIDGERRVRASRLAGLSQIPASIGPSLNGSGKRERLQRALVANVQRSDLNPIEEANAYNELRKCGMTIKEIARKIGVSYARITQRLQLLDLDLEIRYLVAAGDLSKDARVAESLLAIPDSSARVALAEALAKRKATIQTCIKAANTLAKKLADDAPSTAEKIPSLDIAMARTRQPVDLPKWDSLSQYGLVPPWGVVITSCRSTCNACSLRPVASEKTCRDCPAIDLVRRMIEEHSYAQP